MQFIANIFFKGKIKCLTGLHIGGGQDKLEIGGVDSVVIRDPQTQFPMIPGSSFRGKLRTMIEFGLGRIEADGTPSQKIEITRIFGKGADDKKLEEGPTRLLVRDCMPDNNTTGMWKDIETELLYTEFKAENSINRLTSAAVPRFIERVPAESVFDFELILGVYGDTNTLKTDINNLLMGLKMMQHHWLGKSGSRGYGKVEFAMEEPIVVMRNDYIDAKSTKYAEAAKSLKELKFEGNNEENKDNKLKNIYRFKAEDIEGWVNDIASTIKPSTTDEQ